MAQEPLSAKTLKAMQFGDPEVNFGRGLRGKVNKNESVTLILMKRMTGRKSPLRLKVGTWPDMRLDEIESKAAYYRREISERRDPRIEEEEQKMESARKRAAENAKQVPFRQLWGEYERAKEFSDKPNKSATIYDRRLTFEKYFADVLDRPVQEITSTKLEDVLAGAKEAGTISAGRKAIRFIRPILGYAVLNRKYLSENPADALKGFLKVSTEPNKDRLTVSETVNLFDTLKHLDNHPSEFFAKGIKPRELSRSRMLMMDSVALLLLSGLRQREILGLRWNQVFLREDQWDQAGGPYFWVNTKQGQPFGVPITSQMKAVFKRLWDQRLDSQFVFPSPRLGKREDAHLNRERNCYHTLVKLLGPFKETDRLCAAVLRTTFASAALELGLPIDQINLITGHVGDISAYRRTAIGAYLAFTADRNRKSFQFINDVMLDSMENYATGPLPDDDDEHNFEPIPQ